jgi:hypothetical protein
MKVKVKVEVGAEGEIKAEAKVEEKGRRVSLFFFP